MLRFLFLQNLFSLKHFVQRSVSSSSKTYFHSNALWNTQFSLPPKPILTPSQTLCEMLTCLFLQNLLSLKHFVKRSLSSSFKAYSHSNTLWNAHFPLAPKPTHSNALWNAHFPLAPKPTLTQTLCETLTFLLLQSLLSLKRFVKRSLSSSFKAYSHSNTLWNAHFPLPSKATLTQTLCEMLTFLFLQILLSLKHFVKCSVSSCFKTYSHSNTLRNAHFPLAPKPNRGLGNCCVTLQFTSLHTHCLTSWNS